MSAFNIVIDADACCLDNFANATFYNHYALTEGQQRFVQNSLPSRKQLIQRGFLNEQNVLSQRTYTILCLVAWAVNPNLYDRFPLLHPYLYKTRTVNDFFVSGDSGAGYLNPTQLFEPRQFSGLPPADNLWVGRSRFYYNKFNIKHTGFVINGDSGPLINSSDIMYTKFSPPGFTHQVGYSAIGEAGLVRGTRVPSFSEVDLSGPNEVQEVLSYYKPNDVRFLVFRGVLRNASNYAAIAQQVQQIQPNINFVDPYTFALLARLYYGGSGSSSVNYDLVSYVDDTLPRSVSNGDHIKANFFE
jgi:hypothetical protein